MPLWVRIVELSISHLDGWLGRAQRETVLTLELHAVGEFVPDDPDVNQGYKDSDTHNPFPTSNE